MRPYFQDAVEKEFENVVRLHPEYNALIDLVLDSLVVYEGPDREWFRDAIFQASGEQNPSRIDAHFYAKLIGAQCRKRLWWGTIEMGTPPIERQKEQLLNELSLADMPWPFSVEYVTTHGEREAYLEWKQPIVLENGYSREQLNETKEITAHKAVLQIGYTRALTTYLLLEERRFVARWPYGHTRMFLIYLEREPSGTDVVGRL